MAIMKARWKLICLLVGVLLACAALRGPVWRLHKHAAFAPPVRVYLAPHIPALHINSVVRHGRIVEIRGTTDPGAVVMINGEHAAVVFDGHEFRHFVGPLPSGTTIVSITSQNEEGGVNTQKLAVDVD